MLLLSNGVWMTFTPFTMWNLVTMKQAIITHTHITHTITIMLWVHEEATATATTARNHTDLRF